MELSGANKQVATIASGATTSNDVGLGNRRLLAIQIPAAFTGTTLTFQASHDNVTFATLSNAGADVSLTVAAGKYVAVDPSIFAGVEFLRVISGSAEGAARTLYLITGAVLG